MTTVIKNTRGEEEMKPFIILLLVACLGAQEPTRAQISYSGTMQLLDFGLTTIALNQGAVEQNWLMEPVVKNDLLFLGVKVAVFYVSTKISGKDLRRFNLLYTVITLNNIYQLGRLSKR